MEVFTFPLGLRKSRKSRARSNFSLRLNLARFWLRDLRDSVAIKTTDKFSILVEMGYLFSNVKWVKDIFWMQICKWILPKKSWKLQHLDQKSKYFVISKIILINFVRCWYYCFINGVFQKFEQNCLTGEQNLKRKSSKSRKTHARCFGIISQSREISASLNFLRIRTSFCIRH